MNIGIIGAGNVGGTLGVRFANAGHKVYFGVKEPAAVSNLDLLSQAGNNGSIVTVAEAVTNSDVIVIALPYPALKDAVKSIGDFGNRVIIDCNNPISADFSGLTCEGSSAAEQIVEWSGSKRVVKCFNTVGFGVMADPSFNGKPATMLYCGDDAEANNTAASLAADIGFAPVNAGPLLQAKWLESLAWLWISMAVKFGHGMNMAFCLEKK